MEIEWMESIAGHLGRIAKAHERVADALERLATSSESLAVETLCNRSEREESGWFDDGSKGRARSLRDRLVQWAKEFAQRKDNR